MEPAWSGAVDHLEDAKSLPRGHWLYVVSARDAVLYVGQTRQPPYRRLSQHLVHPACMAWQPSPLTDLARENWPEAQGWTINIYEASATNLAEDEARMIRKLRPCLNVTHNVRGRRLPARLTVLRRQQELALIARVHARRSVI